jgi:hypothetical protein
MLNLESILAILGDHPNGSLAFMEFVQTPAASALCRDAVEAERSLGESRVFEFEVEWKLG